MAFCEDLPDGFFFIRTRDAGMAVDVYGGDMTNDANIIIWTQKMTDSINQLWMHEDGFLINKKSGLVMDVKGGELKKDKQLIQYARKAGLAVNQRWAYRDGYIFPHAAPHLVLDIRGGNEFKESSNVFLTTKDPNSASQQWLIQSFDSERSKQDLSLLRPPPHERHFEFPRPQQLFDYYRVVYLEHRAIDDVTPEELAGAVAFKGIKTFILDQKRKNESITVPHARDTLKILVTQELKRLLAGNGTTTAGHHQLSTPQLMRMAEQSAASYFSREYEMS
ncbi:ricin B lectin domain-containing protein [Zychaea mexicana]|uniref:ricin B lectin domain-containing protein n=1 Tax=Zychaea mexicana TaxID=64656 RepID=UPI0022FE7EC0|nr:ricin B lectin domain-containing protein [Zychaea mexicana]KAI9491372.1 ricin B lectin domain-containing protein [Zychaea mexicana]